MSRPLIIALVLLTALAGGAVLQLKNEVGQRIDRLNDLALQIAEDKKDIRVLEAELAYLQSPARLEKKARDHLALMPPEPQQIITSPRAIPLKQAKSTGKSSKPKAPEVPKVAEGGTS